MKAHPPSQPLTEEGRCTECGADPIDEIHWPPVAGATTNDRIVLVLAIDPTHSDAVVQVIHSALKAAWEDDLFNGTQPFGPINLATGDDGDMVLDVFRSAESGGGRHVVKVGDGGWALEHSLVCRRAGLLNCRLTKLVALAVQKGHMEDGEHEVACGPGGVLMWGDDL